MVQHGAEDPTGFVVVENSAVYHNLGRCGRELHSRSLLGT